MAKKTKKSTKASTSGDSVVRIKASSPTKKKTEKAAASTAAVTVEKPAKVKKPRANGGLRGTKALKVTGGYFKGAWTELRQVRWPNRRATWSLTGAVLAYSAFFVILVLLLDAGFKFMFEFILKK